MLRRRGQKYRAFRAPERAPEASGGDLEFGRRSQSSQFGEEPFPSALLGAAQESFSYNVPLTPTPCPARHCTCQPLQASALTASVTSTSAAMGTGALCLLSLFLPPFPFSLSCSFALFACLSVSTRHSPPAQETGISAWPHVSSNIQGVGLG